MLNIDKKKKYIYIILQSQMECATGNKQNIYVFCIIIKFKKLHNNIILIQQKYK